MAHIHNVYDADPHFSIDEDSRAIAYMSDEPLIIIQNDHNSERFTFELPRHIDGHDMSTCNKVQVHFINIGATNTDKRNTGVYNVTDLQIHPEDENKVCCTWLVSNESTKLIGSLNFVIRFACYTGSKVDYAWHTAVYSGVTISTGIDNNEVTAAQYTDILENWYMELIMAGTMGVNIVDEAKVSALNEIEEAKDSAIATVAETGGVVVSEEEPTNEAVKMWLKTETTTGDNEPVEKTIQLLTSDDIAQELGDSEEKVLSQKAATENITPNSFAGGNIGLTPKGLNRNGGYHRDPNFFAMSTDKVHCVAGDVFIYRGRGEYSIASAQFFNGDEFIGYEQIFSTTVDKEIIIPENANFVRFSSFSKSKETFVFEVRKKYNYNVGNLPYAEKKIKEFDNALNSLTVTPEIIANIVNNENLFVKTDNRIIMNSFYAGDAGIVSRTGLHITHPIGVIGGKTYKYARTDIYGKNIKYMVVNKRGDFIAYGVGEYADGFYTFTPNVDCYVMLNIDTLDAVIALADNYPENYVEGKRVLHGVNIPANSVVDFAERVATLTNPLYGKSITFNGDSICKGAGYLGGYAKFIGENNRMTVQNVGVGGGTITAEQYNSSSGNARHWISRTIVNMDETADYAIVEGGVNDSSLNVPLGAITSDYKSELDDTTFYGAFESMLKQLVTRFAGKKYGYIAVHQMTTNFRVGNDPETSYYWAAKKCCEKWGVPFLDLNMTVPPFVYFKGSVSEELDALRTTYTKDGDGWHPNEEGYKKYYVPKIEAWLKTL